MSPQRTTVSLIVIALLGCSGDPVRVTDAGTADGAPAVACVAEPKTHEELINACTADDVEAVEADRELPLLRPDGTLPPLP